MFGIISKLKSYKSACPHEVRVIGVLRTCKVLVHGGEGGQGKLHAGQGVVKWHIALQHFCITCSRHISETLVNLFAQSIYIFFFFCYLSIWPFVASLYIVTSNLTVLSFMSNLNWFQIVMFGSISVINNILALNTNPQL